MAVLEIGVPQRFDLAKAVFSYGWALLCPNEWSQVRDIKPRNMFSLSAI